MSSVGDNLVLERHYAQEESLMMQADAIDTKASICIVAVTFVAQLGIDVLKRPHLDWLAHRFVVIALLCEVVSALCLFGALAISDYSAESATRLPAWRDAALKPNSDHPIGVQEAILIEGLIASSATRIQTNKAINKRKLSLLQPAYILIFASLLISLVALLTLSA
jgi:hypothetical protein